MNVSKHFKRSELECPCCGLYIKNTALLIALEHIRVISGPIIVNSSTRCKKHNAEVGGKDSSKHLTGEAADIDANGLDPDYIYDLLNESGFSNLIGLGSYETFTHIDVRGVRARW
jgi:uncharacterized protein YcbK (DUF882 family)